MSLNKFISMISGSNQQNRYATALPGAAELIQGKTLLRGKQIMATDVGRNSQLMENFTGGAILDPAFSSNQVPSLPRIDYQGPMPEVQMPVDTINQTQMSELKALESQFQQTLTEWATLHQSVVQEVTNLPEQYTQCISKCAKAGLDVDKVNACKFGCNIGKYSVQDPIKRALTGNKPSNSGKFTTASTDSPAYSSALGQFKAIEKGPSTSQGALKSTWSTFYQSACKAGIQNESPAQTKRSQYCKGWQSTQGGASGYYGTPILNGVLKTSESGTYTCDTIIPSSDSGWCECADGRKVGYADKGHSPFSCNTLCSPENVKAVGVVSTETHGRPDAPLYSNSGNWQKKVACYSCGWWRVPKGADHHKQTCENKNNPATGIGAISGPNAVSTDCCAFAEHTIRDKCNQGSVTEYCPVATCPPPPTGGAASKVQNNYTSKNIKQLPTTDDLKKICEDAPYTNLYVDILKLQKLEAKLEQQATAIYAKIKHNSDTGNQIGIYRTAAGQRLLKHLDTYEKVYRRLQRVAQKQLNMAAMAEDAELKVGSIGISYSIWFILAISAMFLVIKHLRK